MRLSGQGGETCGHHRAGTRGAGFRTGPATLLPCACSRSSKKGQCRANLVPPCGPRGGGVGPTAGPHSAGTGAAQSVPKAQHRPGSGTCVNDPLAGCSICKRLSSQARSEPNTKAGLWQLSSFFTQNKKQNCANLPSRAADRKVGADSCGSAGLAGTAPLSSNPSQGDSREHPTTAAPPPPLAVSSLWRAGSDRRENRKVGQHPERDELKMGPSNW